VFDGLLPFGCCHQRALREAVRTGPKQAYGPLGMNLARVHIPDRGAVVLGAGMVARVDCDRILIVVDRHVRVPSSGLEDPLRGTAATGEQVHDQLVRLQAAGAAHRVTRAAARRRLAPKRWRVPLPAPAEFREETSAAGSQPAASEPPPWGRQSENPCARTGCGASIACNIEGAILDG
jgi:hypothetical protein